MMPKRFCLSMLAFWLCTIGLSVSAQQVETTPRDKSIAEIEQAIQSYISAFNSRDVAKLTAHWSPEGVFTSRSSGEQVVGRDAIAKQFTEIFKGDNVPKLAVETESIGFISPNVAFEKGIAIVTHAEDNVVESSYGVVYTKRGGKWLIDHVSDEEIPVDVSNYDYLKELEWLVGEWSDDSGERRIDTVCKWTRNRNYLSRTFKVWKDDEVTWSGLQIIGWDPANQEIRSWLFDSDGGFVAGNWTQRDNQLIVQSVATLADGGKGSSTSVFRPIDDNSYAWKKTNRVVDGEILPNIGEIVIQRK